MLRELLAVFGSDPRESQLAADLDTMIRDSAELVRIAGDVCFQRTEDSGAGEIKRRDKAINKLQRDIRRQVFSAILADTNQVALPSRLAVMNVVKDVERIGDYAKDLAELADLAGPVDASRASLGGLSDLVTEVESLAASLSATMEESDQVKAVHSIDRGKDLRRNLTAVQRALLTEQQVSLHSAGDALAVQFYIRIVGHILNVLSTLVTPIDRMDYVGKKALLPEVKDKLRQEADA